MEINYQTDHNLFKKELLSVVAMKNEEVVQDITSDKHSINPLITTLQRWNI